MMWLVRLALRRPISVAVMGLLMLVLGSLSFFLMNIDIFPDINVPVVMVVWAYPGLASLDMERRVVIISERAYSTTVNGIEHIESESILGVGLLKIYFQPGADIASAIAQVNAVSETILSNLPRGIEPPQIISYNAANVPVAQLDVSSDTKSVQQLFDYAFNFLRLQLFTIPGFSSPARRKWEALGSFPILQLLSVAFTYSNRSAWRRWPRPLPGQTSCRRSGRQ